MTPSEKDPNHFYALEHFMREADIAGLSRTIMTLLTYYTEHNKKLDPDFYWRWMDLEKLLKFLETLCDLGDYPEENFY
jgi:hypothetical protein